jgi:hypothetical protein
MNAHSPNITSLIANAEAARGLQKPLLDKQAAKPLRGLAAYEQAKAIVTLERGPRPEVPEGPFSWRNDAEVERHHQRQLAAFEALKWDKRVRAVTLELEGRKEEI